MDRESFITQGGEGRGKTNKKSKATKSKGRGLEEGASRALISQIVARLSSVDGEAAAEHVEEEETRFV